MVTVGDKMVENRSDFIGYIEKIEHLTQFQEEIDTPADIHQIWEKFLLDVDMLIDSDASALFLVDPHTHEFVLKRLSDQDREDMCRQEIELQIECGMFSSIIGRRQPAIVPSLVAENDRCAVLMPLATPRRTLGLVLLYTSVRQPAVTHENMKLLALLARQCSLVLENTQLYEHLRQKHASLERAHADIRLMSMTDALTGCYNRGYLNEHLTQEIKRARRYGRSLSLVLCDIDHFKRINDTHGHQCGDHVLKEFVGCIMDYIRADVDWLVRYGGEEFLIVLPETELKHARLQVERLRRILARTAIDWQCEQIHITASFGVVGISQGTDVGLTPEGMINSADAFLYQAKNMGRNRVVGGPLRPPILAQNAAPVDDPAPYEQPAAALN